VVVFFNRFVNALMLFLAGVAPVLAETVFVAVPDTHNGTALSGAQQRIGQQLEIRQQGGRFFWQSYGEVELWRSFDRDKVVFTALSGEGMIIIHNRTSIALPQRGKDQRDFLYCEYHRVDMLLESFCGGAERLSVQSSLF
jgi:hypothetical protein